MNTNSWIHWLLVFARVGAVFGVFPFLRNVNIPARLITAFGAIVAWIMSMNVPMIPMERLNLLSIFGLLLIEIGSGLLLGFVSGLLYYALGSVSNVITRELGLQMSAEVNPFAAGENEAPGLILQFLAVTLFFALDMHHWFLMGIQRSYELLPLGHAQLNHLLFLDVLKRTAQVFVIAIQISAPMLAVSFMISVIFSVLARVVEQVNVFTESASFRVFAGLATFGLTLHLMAEHISNYLRRLPEDMLRVAQLLATR